MLKTHKKNKNKENKNRNNKISFSLQKKKKKQQDIIARCILHIDVFCCLLYSLRTIVFHHNNI